MPDTIEKTIFKLELDGSGYINGANSLSDSTKKLSVEQEKANAALRQAEAILKQQSTYLQQTKKDLDAYTGTNEKYRTQLSKSFQSAQADNQKLTEIVNKNRQAYDLAAKAAQDFANVSARAANLQPVSGQGKIPTSPGVTSGITSQISGVLNVAEFAQQAQIIQQTKQEFDDLRISIGLAEERMGQLNATDEEFKALAPIVAKGKEAIQQYDKATKSTGESQGSLRTQLRLGREELVKLEQAGKGATAQYFELEKRVARLTDEFGDQQARIRILASDTKLLDFGKGAITAATSAFQAFTAVSILAGDESAELQKKTMQLFAAMQLLQSLEQLSNLTRREGVLATLAQSGAQTVYTAVVGASTGALKAFRLALVGTGIGAAIVLIGYLVSKWSEYKEQVKKAGEQQKLLTEINAEANKESGKQIADLKILTKAAQDANLPMKERLEAVKALQKEFPDYFGNLSQEAILTGDITKQTEALTKSILAASRARAAKGKIDELETQQLALDQQKQDVQDEYYRKRAAARARTGQRLESLNATREQVRGEIKAQEDLAVADIDDKKKALQREEDFLIKFAGLDKLADVTKDKEKVKTDKKTKDIQNDFEKKKAELDARLAALNAKEANDESKIRIEFAARLAKEQLEITKNKNLTGSQKEILNAELVTINKIELDKALSDFRKKVTDARAKINDDLQNLQDKNAQDSLNLLQNEFDRRAQLIDFNEQKELSDARENTQKRLDSLEFDRLLIGEKAYQDAKAVLIAAGEQNALNITQKFSEQRQALAFDMIQDLADQSVRLFESQSLGLSRLSVIEIQKQNELLAAGKISFEDYQKAISKIGKDEGDKRIENEKKSLQAQINLFSQELVVNNEKLNEDQKTKLLERIRSLEKQLSELEKGKVTKDDPTTETAFDRVAKYATAIGEVANSVAQFWQTANDAESKSLERSIQLQETRVAAAQRIAARGNAQYLKAEEDRLTELNAKRENAARKQLGIDAALQASQILVGITGAISKIATPGIGIAETIAAMAVIFGALATGYGLVKSLQGNQPKLAKGTKDVKRDGHPAGIDTIPAWLNEHEAVLPAHRNKAYHPTVTAIYDGTVPPEHLNQFVKNYHRIKAVPLPNYERIKDAAELSIGHDGKMHVAINEQNRLIVENNDLQRQTLRAMKSMAVSATIDRNGVAIAINEYISQMNIDKKV